MICAGGLLTAVAADNVYSVNVVGYTTVTITEPLSTVLIANQLDDTIGNYLTNHLPSAPTGTQISKYNTTTKAYDTATFTTRWIGAGAGMTIAPGEGFFCKKANTNIASITLTFVGEVMQGALTNPVPPGYDIYSPMVPQQGGLSSVHGYKQGVGDQAFIWLPASKAYQTKTVNSLTNWIGGEPVISVNQAIWIKNNSATVTNFMGRVFTVN
jgi:hypothetical protein